MAYSLFLTVQQTPNPCEISSLQEFLETSFPHQENRAYFQAISGTAAVSTHPSTIVQRLGALSLLPSLLSTAKIPQSSLIFRRNSHGRPFFDPSSTSLSQIDFNLSHTKNYIAAALLIGDGYVGVDVEDVIPAKRAVPLSRRYCTEGELRTFKECMNDEELLAERFTSVWVKREALSKQHGEGMPLRYDAASIPGHVKLWAGSISGANAKIAICAPNIDPPSIPFVLSDSISLDIQ